METGRSEMTFETKEEIEMLKVKNIQLLNYRGFKDTKISFNPRITCLAGINGVGKSSALDAIALCLSWIIARIKKPNGQGRFAKPYIDVRYGERSGSIQSELTFFDKEIYIKQGFSVDGAISDIKSDYSSLSTLFDYVNTSSMAYYCIPTLVYYPINRAVLDIPLRIRTKHSFNQFSVYDKALDSSARFRDFFEWYREREDIENAEIKKRKDFDYKDQILETVRNAIYSFLPGYKNLSIQRTPQMMMITKNGEDLPVDSLSDGEKCMLSLVGDLARRLSLANSNLSNPLEGSGIVLIDEIDLHLHPSWQRKIVQSLLTTFPNCQFIITTHSPLVLGELQPDEIRLIDNFKILIPSQSFGLDSNSIIQSLMKNKDNEDFSLNVTVKKKLTEVSDLIASGKYKDAKEKLDYINEMTHGSTPDSIRLMSILTTMGA